MFKYQGSPYLDIFSTQGSNPLSKCKLVNAKSIKRVFEKKAKSYVIDIGGSGITTFKIPKEDRKNLGIIQKYLCLQLFVEDGNSLKIELGIQDLNKTRRRLVFSTSFKEVQVTPLHTQIPLFYLPRGIWTNFCLDLGDICQSYFEKGQEFHCLDNIMIYPSCRVRKIFSLKSRPFETEPQDDDPTTHNSAMEISRKMDFSPGVDSITFVANSYKITPPKTEPSTEPSIQDSISPPRSSSEKSKRHLTSTRPKYKGPMHVAFGRRAPVPSKLRGHSARSDLSKIHSSPSSRSRSTISEVSEDSQRTLKSDNRKFDEKPDDESPKKSRLFEEDVIDSKKYNSENHHRNSQRIPLNESYSSTHSSQQSTRSNDHFAPKYWNSSAPKTQYNASRYQSSKRSVESNSNGNFSITQSKENISNSSHSLDHQRNSISPVKNQSMESSRENEEISESQQMREIALIYSEQKGHLKTSVKFEEPPVYESMEAEEPESSSSESEGYHSSEAPIDSHFSEQDNELDDDADDEEISDQEELYEEYSEISDNDSEKNKRDANIQQLAESEDHSYISEHENYKSYDLMKSSLDCRNETQSRKMSRHSRDYSPETSYQNHAKTHGSIRMSRSSNSSMKRKSISEGNKSIQSSQGMMFGGNVGLGNSDYIEDQDCVVMGDDTEELDRSRNFEEDIERQQLDQLTKSETSPSNPQLESMSSMGTVYRNMFSSSQFSSKSGKELKNQSEHNNPSLSVSWEPVPSDEGDEEIESYQGKDTHGDEDHDDQGKYFNESNDDENGDDENNDDDEISENNNYDDIDTPRKCVTKDSIQRLKDRIEALGVSDSFEDDELLSSSIRMSKSFVKETTSAHASQQLLDKSSVNSSQQLEYKNDNQDHIKSYNQLETSYSQGYDNNGNNENNEYNDNDENNGDDENDEYNDNDENNDNENETDINNNENEEENLEDKDEDSDEELELMFDPVLNCFFDPHTMKYYELKNV